MDIEEKVIVKNSHERNRLHTMLVTAMRGEYVDIVCGDSLEDKQDLTRLVCHEFDLFAQECFDRGREYERQRAK